jgi:hypothetical protein
MSALYGGRDLRDDEINYKPSLVYPSEIIAVKKDYMEPDDIKNLLKMEFETRKSLKDKDVPKLVLDPQITDEERRERRLKSHKPDFCGSCGTEQRFDDEKYCHKCQRDAGYNPHNLAIGGEGKCIQDYNRRKEEEYYDPYNLTVNCKNVRYIPTGATGAICATGCPLLPTYSIEKKEPNVVMAITQLALKPDEEWEEFQLFKEFIKLKYSK